MRHHHLSVLSLRDAALQHQVVCWWRSAGVAAAARRSWVVEVRAGALSQLRTVLICSDEAILLAFGGRTARFGA